MQEKKLVTIFRKAKIMQLCALLAIEAFFIGVLVANPSMTRRIYEDRTLYLLCAAVWVLMIFSLSCLVYDLFRMRSFVKENYVLNRESPNDPTGLSLSSRHGMDMIFQTYDTPKSIANVGCCMVTIDSQKAANQSDNRQAEDQLIRDFSSILESVGELYGIVGRSGRSEFLIAIDSCDKETLERFIHDLEDRIISYNLEHERLPLQFQSAYTLNCEERMEAFAQLLNATYNRLYSK